MLRFLLHVCDMTHSGVCGCELCLSPCSQWAFTCPKLDSSCRLHRKPQSGWHKLLIAFTTTGNTINISSASNKISTMAWIQTLACISRRNRWIRTLPRSVFQPPKLAMKTTDLRTAANCRSSAATRKRGGATHYHESGYAKTQNWQQQKHLP